MIEKCQDPDFEEKYAAENEKHAKESSTWVMKGMKEDASK